MKHQERNRILVIGTGNFGTCLAQHVAEKGYSVTVWTRSAETAAHINESKRNPKYLSTINLSGRIDATDKIDEETVGRCSVIILAIPTQALRITLTRFKTLIKAEHLLVSALKGIEVGTLMFPSAIIGDILGRSFGSNTVVLSGPSFASEVVARQPTAVSLASFNKERCAWAQEIFHASHFRAYTLDDPIGLEVAGALKNVIAIAAGGAMGIGFQQNSLAALLTRGLAEMTRIGVAMGANPITFNGLGGVGDLFLTCTSDKSRNYTVGFRLGRGEPLEHVMTTMGSVAEGVTTAASAYELASKLGVDAPIIGEVYQVLYHKKPIVQAVTALMTREAKAEFTLPPGPQA